MLRPSDLLKISLLIGVAVASLTELASRIPKPTAPGPLELSDADLQAIDADIQTQLAPLKATLEALAVPAIPVVPAPPETPPVDPLT